MRAKSITVSESNVRRNIDRCLLFVNSGKMNRGMTVLSTWRLLLGDKTPSDEEYFSAIVLAWCVELVS